jgi:hypothetical protein
VRESIDPVKTSSFGTARVQPLQLLDIADYEKLLGLAKAGEDIPMMLARKAAGPFSERNLAAWLHGDRAAPSDEPRLHGSSRAGRKSATESRRWPSWPQTPRVKTPRERRNAGVHGRPWTYPIAYGYRRITSDKSDRARKSASAGAPA